MWESISRIVRCCSPMRVPSDQRRCPVGHRGNVRQQVRVLARRSLIVSDRAMIESRSVGHQRARTRRAEFRLTESRNAIALIATAADRHYRPPSLPGSYVGLSHSSTQPHGLLPYPASPRYRSCVRAKRILSGDRFFRNPRTARGDEATVVRRVDIAQPTCKAIRPAAGSAGAVHLV